MVPSGFDHVSIIVTDLGVARRFYGEVMGLVEAERPSIGVDGAWYAAGTQQLHLVVGAAMPERSAQHFALRLDDVDAAADELEGQGVAVRRVERRAGARQQATLRDPFGNLIELTSPAAGPAPQGAPGASAFV